MSTNSARPTKNERRQQAREQARIAREKELKREKRRRRYIQGGVVLGVLAVLAIVALVVYQTVKPAGPGPANMASGGVVFTTGGEVKEGPGLASGESRKAPEVDRSQLPLDVTVYADYMCPACGSFEQTYGETLSTYLNSGDLNLEIYPINFLDGQSQGTKYSTRAANLMSCVVDQQPAAAYSLHNALLSAEVQPAEGTVGLSDEELLAQAEAAGATADDALTSCVEDQQYASFIDGNTVAATETGILGLEDDEQLIDASSGDGSLQEAGEPQVLMSTPLVIVNGRQWDGQTDGDLAEYILKIKAEVEQANGEDGGNSEPEETTAPTETPTPEPTSEPTETTRPEETTEPSTDPTEEPSE